MNLIMFFMVFIMKILIINTEEADDFKWIDMETLNNDIALNGQNYTVWFKIAFDYFYKYLNNDNNK